MASPHVNMEIPFPRVIGSIGCGELGKKRPGMFGKRVKKPQVHAESDELNYKHWISSAEEESINQSLKDLHRLLPIQGEGRPRLLAKHLRITTTFSFFFDTVMKTSKTANVL